jgi:hypothetical protein
VLTTLPGSRMSGAINIEMANKILQCELGYKTANKGAGLCDGWKVFFDASLTCSCVLLMVGDLAKDSSFV